MFKNQRLSTFRIRSCGIPLPTQWFEDISIICNCTTIYTYIFMYMYIYIHGKLMRHRGFWAFALCQVATNSRRKKASLQAPRDQHKEMPDGNKKRQILEMYVCMYVCMYVYIYIHIYIYLCICMYLYAYIYIYMQLHIWMYVVQNSCHAMSNPILPAIWPFKQLVSEGHYFGWCPGSW